MPQQLQRAMAAEQEATRQAKAKIAAADGELQSATALKKASETMSKNPISLQLRYLQTLNVISADKNHTIVVPFPLDIVRKFTGSNSKEKSEKKNLEKPVDSESLEFSSNSDDAKNSLSKHVQTDQRDSLIYSSDS